MNKEELSRIREREGTVRPVLCGGRAPGCILEIVKAVVKQGALDKPKTPFGEEGLYCHIDEESGPAGIECGAEPATRTRL